MIRVAQGDAIQKGGEGRPMNEKLFDAAALEDSYFRSGSGLYLPFRKEKV